MSVRPLLVAAGLAGLFAPAARGEAKLHPLFTPHMVLQRDQPIAVFGTADPGETVNVLLRVEAATSVAEKGIAVTADAKGQWKAALPALPASKPGDKVTLTVNKTVLDDVLVGDVWLCSGQSNMEWRLSQLTIDDQGKKVADKAADPGLRLFVVPNRAVPEPQADFPQTAAEGRWLECKPDTVINFSAVGYFFGRDLRKALGVPVGLIASDWGGTPAQAWTSREALDAVPELKYYHETLARQVKTYDEAKAKAAYETAMAGYPAAVKAAKDAGKPTPPRPQPPVRPEVSQRSPSTLYNGMIAPLVRFPVAGAVWYQGEANASKAFEYRTLLPTLVKDWRARWGRELPFFVVQLAPYRGLQGPAGADYAELRDAQRHAADTLPKAGLAVITDAGDETDIHPQKKEPAGVRLALAALAVAYGKDVEHRGPTFKKLTVEGSKAVVAFDHVGGGLVVKGEPLAGFQLAGADGQFVPAKAEIAGDTVVVTADGVDKPTAVRFGWVNFAKPGLNLFNKAGLPAVPFRTDDRPYTTQPK